MLSREIREPAQIAENSGILSDLVLETASSGALRESLFCPRRLPADGGRRLTPKPAAVPLIRLPASATGTRP